MSKYRVELVSPQPIVTLNSNGGYSARLTLEEARELRDNLDKGLGVDADGGFPRPMNRRIHKLAVEWARDRNRRSREVPVQLSEAGQRLFDAVAEARLLGLRH